MLPLLQDLSKEAFAVYLVLKARVDEKPKKMGMTLMEISRLANVGVSSAEMCLQELNGKGLIVVENNKITLNGHDSHIPFTKQNTDSERLKKLELECQRLREVLANYQKSSGLAQIADEFDRSVIRKIEGLYGRGLNSDEAYLLGRCLEGYGPNRTLSAVQNSIMTNNPLRAAYGMLRGGAVGKKMNRGEIPEPKVRTANVDFLEE